MLMQPCAASAAFFSFFLPLLFPFTDRDCSGGSKIMYGYEIEADVVSVDQTGCERL